MQVTLPEREEGMRIRLVLRAMAISVLAATAGLADALPPPEGPVVLTVTGPVEVTNSSDGANFDLALLAETGQASFRSTTIWTEGEQVFTGTPLRAVLDRLKITAGTLRAVALNDYHAEIPVDEVTKDAPLLAWQVDGEYLTVRNRGPVWIVYPYDRAPEFRTDLVYARSVWQLTRLELLDGHDG